MTMTTVVTVGELSLDDVVCEDSGCSWKQPGGGALYSAIGALLWQPDVGISAVVGCDYPDSVLADLGDCGLDVNGIERTSRIGTLGLWLLYERGGRRHQIAKEYGPTFEALDSARSPWLSAYPRPAGVHIAPQSTAGQCDALRAARVVGCPTTLDLLIEPFIDSRPYRDGSALQGLTAFLPSEQEMQQLWDHTDSTRLHRWLTGHADVNHLVVKRGAAGVDVVTPDRLVRVPAVPLDVVDDTGAGDAFCGGFLAGLLQTGDPVEAASYGVVSSSFVIQTRGAVDALRCLDATKARRRLDGVHRRLGEEDRP